MPRIPCVPCPQGCDGNVEGGRRWTGVSGGGGIVGRGTVTNETCRVMTVVVMV